MIVERDEIDRDGLLGRERMDAPSNARGRLPDPQPPPLDSDRHPLAISGLRHCNADGWRDRDVRGERGSEERGGMCVKVRSGGRSAVDR